MGFYSALLARAVNEPAAPIFEDTMGFEKELGGSLGKRGRVFRQEKEAMEGESRHR